MKNICRIVTLLLVLCMVVGTLASCQFLIPGTEPGTEETSEGTSETTSSEGSSEPSEVTTGEKEPPKPEDFVDYVSGLKLDMSTNTLKQEVTVKSYIDGDTTHFHVPATVMENLLLKARYLAVNTPESTGKIEEYGKRASKFTKEKLSTAVSIIIESDNDQWNLDSTGGRHLVWVWYKPAEGADYRNLNLELLQNGLAIGSNSGGNRYGETCLAALTQARTYKLSVFSGEPDPDFPYGTAQEITLAELRYNIADYDGQKVAFEGVVAKNNNGTIYVEAYDDATGIYNGISVYLGYGLPGAGLEILTVGNLVRIVGTVQYYETGETYQVSGLQYRAMRPDDPDNIQLVETGHSGAFTVTDPKQFAEGKVDVTLEDADGNVETKQYAYSELVMNTTIAMNNLKVVNIYTTDNPDSSSKGAMTLTCKAEDGTTITVRTEVLYDADGNLVTESAYKNQTISVKGIVDYFDGYQIKVMSVADITIH